MENNRFDYFSDIEEHFCRRRGTVLVASTLDWVLMESWKDAGVPLEAVLRGIDATFEKWGRRPSKTRKVNSLAYCAQEVLAATEEMKEAAVGSVREPHDSGMERARVAAFLEKNAKVFESAKVCDAAQALILEDGRKLAELAKQAATEAEFSLEELERRLTVMEEKLFAVLLSVSPDDLLVEVRAQAERELAPYRSKMSGPQIEQLLKQYTNKRLLEHYGLPRLSLFYM